LQVIEAPSATPTWKPIKHVVFVDTIHEELKRREIEVRSEEYAVQRKGNYLFGVMTLNYLKTDAFAAALAFRHSNDMSEAVKMYAGVRVFACDNMVLSGNEIILHRKHTPRFDLAAALPEAFDRYHEGELILQRNIDDLMDSVITTNDVKSYIFDIFRKKIVPIRLFHPVVDDWHQEFPNPDSQGTMWRLLNCFTNHTKKLAPGPQMRTTVKIGRYFGLGRENPYVPA
jgi:hypothetical protein